MTATVPTGHRYPTLTPTHLEAFAVMDMLHTLLDRVEQGREPTPVEQGSLRLMAALAELIAVVASPPQGAASIDAASRTVEVRYGYLLNDIEAASRAAELAS